MKPARSKDTSTVYQQALLSGQAIALYRLPDKKTVRSIAGTVTNRLAGRQAGFAFVPFDTSAEPFYILASPPHVPQEGAIQTALIRKAPQKSTSKKQYTGLVKRIIETIKKGELKKVVAARVVAIDKPDTFDPVVFFEKLCRQYPTAFVSLTYIPGAGLWLGASPEILVSERKSGLTVYSLAGTRSIMNDNNWNDKELREQAIVTDFIRKRLSKLSDGKISEHGPDTHYAGHLKHLLTVFTMRRDNKNAWRQVAKALHPTPAVGGLPQKRSVAFINREESFKRDFYAGYLGPTGQKRKSDLFVNLRCMQVTDKQLLFYAGCGVTLDSDPEKEWIESERKIDVLKSLI